MKNLTEKDIKRRNHLIGLFFKANGFDVTIMGSLDNPLFATTDNIVLSCFAHNFELIFKDDSFDGTELFRVQLKSIPLLLKEKVSKWFTHAKHRKVYLFKFNGLYFSRYERREKIMALFTPEKELAYYVFKRQKALEIIDQLSKEKINLSIDL